MHLIPYIPHEVFMLTTTFMFPANTSSPHMSGKGTRRMMCHWHNTANMRANKARNTMDPSQHQQKSLGHG